MLTAAGDALPSNSTDSALLCSVKADAASACAESRERSAAASAGLCALALAACFVSDARDDAGSASPCVSAPHSHSDSAPNHVSEKRAPSQSEPAADGYASPIADTAHCGSKREHRRPRHPKAKSSLSVASVAYLLLAANCLHTFVCD